MSASMRMKIWVLYFATNIYLFAHLHLHVNHKPGRNMFLLGFSGCDIYYIPYVDGVDTPKPVSIIGKSFGVCGYGSH
jgi:hypothetical protein